MAFSNTETHSNLSLSLLSCLPPLLNNSEVFTWCRVRTAPPHCLRRSPFGTRTWRGPSSPPPRPRCGSRPRGCLARKCRRPRRPFTATKTTKTKDSAQRVLKLIFVGVFGMECCGVGTSAKKRKEKKGSERFCMICHIASGIACGWCETRFS